MNAIWELKDAKVYMISSPFDLELEEILHFRNIFKNPKEGNIQAHLEFIKQFPSFFSVEEGLKVGNLVKINKVEDVLKGLAKVKSLEPNGWKMEFSLHFFDIISQDILVVMRNPRLKGMSQGIWTLVF